MLDVETLSWIAADGTEIPFDNSAGVRAEAGPDGRFMPPFELTEQEASDGGGWVTAAVAKMRTISLPLAFDSDSALGARFVLRIMQRAFDPSLGAGKLRARIAGGTTREIYCWYQSGLEIDDGLATPDLTDYRATVKLRADAAWLDASEETISWRTGDAPGGFFPFLPLRLAASEIFSSAPVTASGDFDTQPLWTITGPAETITARNVTTGRVWTWGASVGADEQLVIDTRRRPDTNTPKSVTVSGTNRYGDLDAWDLWPLVPGSNQVQVELTGATTATEVAMRWRNRWLGA